MSEQEEKTERTNNVNDLNKRRDQQKSQRENENRAAIEAAENEGLPVVGLGDERPSWSDKEKAVVIKAPAKKTVSRRFKKPA